MLAIAGSASPVHAAQAYIAAANPSGYTPGPVQVGWEVWVGAAAGKPDVINMLVWQPPCIVTAYSAAAVPPVFFLRAGVIPFIIGAYEFGKRILIQRRCQVCEGSGLVQRGRYLRKCPEASAHAPCTLHAGKPAALCPTCKDRQLSHHSLSAVWWILSMAGLGQVLHIYCSPWQWGAFEGPERADISLL